MAEKITVGEMRSITIPIDHPTKTRLVFEVKDYSIKNRAGEFDPAPPHIWLSTNENGHELQLKAVCAESAAGLLDAVCLSSITGAKIKLELRLIYE